MYYTFEEHLREEKRKSENTIKTYIDSTDHFLKSAKNSPPIKEDVQSYLKHLHKENSINTVNVRLSALRAYCEYNQLTELLTYIDTLERDKPIVEPVANKLNAKNLEAMRAYFTGKSDFESLLIFDIMSDYGARISEVLVLRKKDFTEITIVLTMTKNKRVRHLDLTPHVRETLSAYLKSKDIKKDDELLFSGVSRHAIYKRLLRVAGKLGFPKQSPHKFRHYRATMQSQNMTAFELQHYFGWKTLSIAARYVDVDSKRINNKALNALRLEQEAVAV